MATLERSRAAATSWNAWHRESSPASARAAAATFGPLTLFAVAFGLRAVLFTSVPAWWTFAPPYFGFGWEAGRIASALVAGQGFANPFGGTTGPTAWVAPVYPLVLAALFRVFGVFTPLAGWATLAFNSACSAGTAVLLYHLGRDLFGERVGRRAGWTWALLPYEMYWPTRVIWDTSLPGTRLVLVVLLTVRLSRAPSLRAWLGWGAAWGLLALTNPAPLAFAAPSALWVGGQLRRRAALRPVHAAAGVLAALAVVAPWLVRNAGAFSTFVFIRSNFGEELRLGNGPDAVGTWMGWRHPVQNRVERARYGRMGEVAYVAAEGREALAAIADEPGRFAANSLRRAYWFWCGTTKGEAGDLVPLLRTIGHSSASALAMTGLVLLVRRRRPEAVLFGALFAFYPLVYYVTFVISRYRHPIEPEMLLLIVYALSARSSSS